MGIIISITTVLFFILAVLLVILILLQSDKSAGMGILGGSSQSTFGSSTADIITKITGFMVGLFMIGSLGLSVLESYRSGRIDEGFVSSDTEESIVADEEKEDSGKNQAEPEDNNSTQ
jgi:preprotein translocase subunit SecG